MTTATAFNPNGNIYILLSASQDVNVKRMIIYGGIKKVINQVLEAGPVELKNRINSNPEEKLAVISNFIDQFRKGQGENPVLELNDDTFPSPTREGLDSGFITVQGVSLLPNGDYRLAISADLSALYPNEPAFRFVGEDGKPRFRHANGFVDLSREKLELNGMLKDVESYLAEAEKGLAEGTIIERDSSLGGRFVLQTKQEMEEGQRGFALRDLLFNRNAVDTQGRCISGIFISIAPPRTTQNDLSRRINHITISSLSCKATMAKGADVSSVEEQLEEEALFGISRKVPATTAPATTAPATTAPVTTTSNTMSAQEKAAMYYANLQVK